MTPPHPFRPPTLPLLPPTAPLRRVAARVIWFESADDALSDAPRFVAYTMTYGTHREMNVVRQYLSDDDLRAALALAPAGIFDPRSWAYWHARLGIFDPPPMPERTLPAPLTDEKLEPAE